MIRCAFPRALLSRSPRGQRLDARDARFDITRFQIL